MEEREGDEGDPYPVPRFTKASAAYGTVRALANMMSSAF